MKKLLSILVAAGVLSAANVMAKDVNLVDMAQQAQEKIDAATKKMEDAKSVSSAKTDYKSQIEAKKAEVEAKIQAKKDAAVKKQADDKAATEAKKAERQKAIDDTKNSLKSLKNSFTAE